MNIKFISSPRQDAETLFVPGSHQKAVCADTKQAITKEFGNLGRQLSTQDDVVDLRAGERDSTKQTKEVSHLPDEATTEKGKPIITKESLEPSIPKSFEGYNLAPEKQAPMMAENHQSVLNIREIYEKMNENSRNSLDEMRKIRNEANLSISEFWSKATEKRTSTQARHFEAWLEIFSKSSEY